MQLLPLVLVGFVLAADAGFGFGGGTDRLSTTGSIAWSLGPLAGVAVLAAVLLGACERRLAQAASPRTIIMSGRIMTACRWLIVAQFGVAVLTLGWLTAVRSLVGDLVLLDEALCLLPPVLALMVLWWAQYPIERRFHEAMIIRRIDGGGTVSAIPTRWQHVVFQLKSGLLLLLVPLLAILALTEVVDRVTTDGVVAEIGRVAALIVVFATAPLMIRWLLSVRPMPPGETRESLLDICRRYGVRVREVLLWETGGMLVNAAVMGLVGRMRYVMMTDALLESMSPAQVRAVMAHEVAHVRHRHIPWLVASLFASISGALLIMVLVVAGLDALGWLPLTEEGELAPGVMSAAVVAELLVAFPIFGWVSRRFERQADTFAVQHLSATEAVDGAAPDRVSFEAVRAMQDTLGRVAWLSTTSPKQRSWRHGSIAWRQAYLDTIVGLPLDRVPIDRLVRRLKWTVAAVLLLSLAANWWIA